MENPPWTLSVPIKVPLSRKTDFHLNLNQYRNAHYQTLNKAKHSFTKLVTPIIRQLPKMQAVKLGYRLFPGSKRDMDTSNICSIVDKFFCDALVQNERLSDDHRKIVLEVNYSSDVPDKADPRVEVTITPVGEYLFDPPNKENESVQIIIVEAEIKEAIKKSILSQINVRNGMDIKIELKATRGDLGYQAIIDIVPLELPELPEETIREVQATQAQLTQAKMQSPVVQAVESEEEPPVRKKPGPKPRVTMVDLKKAQAEEAANEDESEEGEEEEGETSTPEKPDQSMAEETAEEEESAPAAKLASQGTEDQPEAQEPPKPKKNLFGGLKRPVNLVN